MSAPESALQQALQLHREPGLLFAMQGSRLPADIAQLLRIVGDDVNAQEIADRLAIGRVELQHLTANYLQAVCLHSASEPLRCLGLNDAQDLRLAKEHHRLLMKWLHPDRNANQQVFAERVNHAWTQLKSGRFAERMPIAKAWQDQEVSAPSAPTSRFPLFLGVLFALGMALLALSVLWPEQEIYGTEVSNATAPPAGINETADPDRLDLPDVNWQSVQGAPKPEPKTLPAPKAPTLDIALTQKSSSTVVTKPVIVSKARGDDGLTPESKHSPFIQAESDLVNNAGATPPPIAVVTTAAKNPADPSLAQNASKTSSAAVPSQAEAMQVLQAFMRYYQSGQITPFMALFSANAQNDRGGRAAIAEDYARLFNASQRRTLDLSRLHWQPQSFGWRVNARYISKVQRESDLLPVKNKGTIELDFADEGGRLTIRRIALK